MTKQVVAFIAGAFLVLTLPGQRVLYAYESRLDEPYVSRKEYEKLKQELEGLKAQMQVLQNNKGAPPHKEPSPRPEPKPAPKVAQAKTEPAGAAQPADSIAPGDREKEAEEVKRQLDEFLRRQKLLFKPGELGLEFGLAYIQDTSERLLNIGGGQFISKSALRLVNTNLTARYGLAENLELDVAVPFVYTDQKFDFITQTPRVVNSAAGLGDISGALRYAAWREKGIRPDVVLSLTGKSRTGDEDRGLGSGHWNVGSAVTLVKTIDPVVFFGSVGYTATLERDEIDPGDQIPYSLGMGFSLNDRVSFLMSLAGSAVRRTEVRGSEIAGSTRDIDTFQFSTTVQVARNLFLEPFVGFGLTKDSADFLVGISIPYRLEGGFPLPFFHDPLEN